MSTKPQPAKLQVNNSGAWKDIARFDAADLLNASRIADAAETLGRVDQQLKFRIVADATYPKVMLNWTADTGWKKARHADN